MGTSGAKQPELRLALVVLDDLLELEVVVCADSRKRAPMGPRQRNRRFRCHCETQNRGGESSIRVERMLLGSSEGRRSGPDEY